MTFGIALSGLQDLFKSKYAIQIGYIVKNFIMKELGQLLIAVVGLLIKTLFGIRRIEKVEEMAKKEK